MAKRRRLARIHDAGLFAGALPNGSRRYQLRARFGETVVELDDPYRFPPVLSDFDLYLLGEGTHQRIYDKLGAHPMTLDGVPGVGFVVLAPNARRVSVVGDFNFWDSRRHAMRVRGVGYWELFIPHAKPGDHYKFDIVGPTRPALAAEIRSAGICQRDAPEDGIDRFRRGQAAASAAGPRQHQRAQRPDVDLRGPPRLVAAQGPQRMADLSRAGGAASKLCPRSRLYPCRISARQRTSIRRLVGLPADRIVRADQPFWRPEDFAALVDACHREGLAVMLDWVPGHFPDDPHGLGNFDGTALYEHANPLQGRHLDWGTLIYNYGRTEVVNFLVSNALFWLERYGIDGLRVDAVASMLYLDYSRPAGGWIPNKYGGRENLDAIDFLRRFNTEVFARFPQATTAAEESPPGRRCRAGRIWRASASATNGTWAGCTTR
jgi:1,4-alpha-glucan branching enzyme